MNAPAQSPPGPQRRRTVRQALANKYRAIHAKRYHRSRYSDLQGRINHALTHRALLRSLASLPSGSRVLDVPCGTGQFCFALAQAGHSVTGMDISQPMLDEAHSRGSSDAVTLRRGDIFELPFADKSFDAAVCIRFTNLISARLRIKAARELARVASVVVISYHHCYSLKYASRWLRYTLKLRGRMSPRHTRATLQRELALAGLEMRQLVRVAPFLSEVWLAVLQSHAVGTLFRQFDNSITPVTKTRYLRSD